MKKLLAIAAFAASILAVSCVKGEENGFKEQGDFFYASLQPLVLTKASGQFNYNIVWDDGDEISVLDAANVKAAFKLSEGAGTSSGTFHQEGSDVLTAPLVAYYPASVAKDDKTLEWPATQADVVDISNVPMMASSSNATGEVNFEFKHLGSVLQLVLTAINGEIDIKQVDIAADQGLSGAFTVADSTAVISNTGTSITTGDISDQNIKLSATASFLNFAVPAGKFTNFVITITDTSGKKYSLSSESLTMNRAMVNKVPFAMDVKNGALFVLKVNGHTVRIQRSDETDIDKDVLVEAYTEGNDVIVTAKSLSGKYLKCFMTDGEHCTRQNRTTDMTYTFTISDITEDTTATIGYAKTVSVSASPENAGTIKVEGELYEGETVKLVSLPVYEYGISCWKDNNGVVLSDDRDYTTRLSCGVQSITAVFEENLVLGGIFTVNDKGSKVRFTRGNLYYDGSSKIEQYQYEFNRNTYTSSTDHVSHFMWCRSLAESVKKTYSETGSSSGDILFTNRSDFKVNGFSKGDCFVLSDWEYLLNGREGISTVNGTENARYFLGCIQNEEGKLINGMFIFPDVFTWPASVKGQPREINRYPVGYNNRYSYNEFKKLQDAGLVFLPAAGDRLDTSINDVDITGYYWSATPLKTNEAYFLNFNTSAIIPMYTYYRRYAFAVRLVTKVTE